MSPDLHPSWQNEPGAEPVPVRIRPSQEEQPRRVTVSRRPAAVAGILVVLGVMASVYGTHDLFPGQAVGTTPVTTGITVRITETGFEPAKVSVRPGDTVTWINQSTIPHILTSESVETVDGPLDTSPIFPESSVAVTIAKTAKTGTFTYISQTSVLTGQLEVNTATPTSVVSSVVVSSASSVNNIPVSVAASSVPAQVAVSSVRSVVRSTPSSRAPVSSRTPTPVVPVIPTTAIGAIPRNPYAINKPDYVDPVQPVSSASSKKSSTAHAGAPVKASVTDHKPKTQPGSGPENWIVAFGALVALTALATQALRRKAWTYDA